jgi:hypothetical protein
LLLVVAAVALVVAELTAHNQSLLGMVVTALQFRLRVQVSLTLVVGALLALQTQTLLGQAVQASAVMVLHQVQAMLAQLTQVQAVVQAVTATVALAVAE